MRLILTIAVAVGLALTLAPEAVTQPVVNSGGCDLATMPPLPPGADRQPVARRGYDWTPGHYRCTLGGWSYQAGYWRRAGALVDATAFVISRNGRLTPRVGYQFIRQGSGVAVARIAGGDRGGPGIAGTFACNCDRGSGSCGVIATADDVRCLTDGCTGTCRMTFVILGATGGITRYSRRARFPVYLETDCLTREATTQPHRLGNPRRQLRYDGAEGIDPRLAAAAR